MPHAPIWKADGGFGGDGASDAPTTVGDGGCVRDRPFSHFEAPYYGDQAHRTVYREASLHAMSCSKSAAHLPRSARGPDPQLSVLRRFRC
jgi:hypothetical protein